MIKTPLSTAIGGALWTPTTTILGGTSKTFNQIIQSLFANGEQGFAYDPNDLSTMYQGAGGSTPVTAVEQPVGLILDKSNEMTLGEELQPSGDIIGFSSGQQGVVTTDTQFTTVNNGHGVAKKLFTIGKFYAVSVSGSSTASFTVNTSDSASPTSRTQFRAGFGTCIIQADKPFLYLRNDTGGTTNITSISVRELSGNHAYQTTSAARPILRQNATTGANYLEFDGSDDFLQTANIDFTGTDKVTVLTVIKKQNEAEAVIIDHGIGQEKSFRLQRGWGLNNQALYITMQPPITTLNIPLEDAPTGVGLVVTQKLSRTTSPSIYLKVNTKTHQNTSVMNAGNFGNYPLFIGRRNDATLAFNGHIYSLIGVGKLVSDDETVAIEKELAKRVGVTL